MKDNLRSLFISIIIVFSLIGLVLAGAFVVTDMIKSLAKNDDPVEPPVNVTYWTGGSDTSWFDVNNKKTVYVLRTPEQFAGFSDLVNGGETFSGITVKLGANMTFNSDLDSDNVKPFTTIGDALAHQFKGIFDGQNCSLNNLFINKESSARGLFGFVDNAVLSNFRLYNIKIISSTGGVGAVVGRVGNATVENVNVCDANIIAAGGYVGGIAGYPLNDSSSTNLTIKSCSFNGNIGSSKENQCSSVGGIIGGYSCSSGNVIITDCVASLSVEKYCDVSAIVGVIGKGTYDFSGNKIDITVDFNGITAPTSSTHAWNGLCQFKSSSSSATISLKDNELTAVLNNCLASLNVENVEYFDMNNLFAGYVAATWTTDHNSYTATINVA